MLGENIKTVTQYFGYTLCHCLGEYETFSVK